MKPPFLHPAVPSLLALAFAFASVGAHAQAPATPAGSNAPAAASPSAAATDPLAAPDTVLISNGLITLTRGDYDLELTKLPANARGGFGADPKRVNALLNRMLVTKTLAAQARAAGIEKQAGTQRRVATELDRVLAAQYIEDVDAQAAKEFDARPGLDTAARERWLADPDKYKTEEQINLTHIVFDVSKHSKEQALELAKAARAKIIAGANMNELAAEISEDPTAKRTGGRIDGFRREQVDAAFTTAAFALKNPGDISEPVLSRLGYHVIRLESRQPPGVIPFADVKALIIDELRRQYVEQRRNERLAAIRDDPKIVVNEPAVDSLVIRVDPEVYKKAMEAANRRPPANPAPK